MELHVDSPGSVHIVHTEAYTICSVLHVHACLVLHIYCEICSGSLCVDWQLMVHCACKPCSLWSWSTHCMSSFNLINWVKEQLIKKFMFTPALLWPPIHLKSRPLWLQLTLLWTSLKAFKNNDYLQIFCYQTTTVWPRNFQSAYLLN